MIPTASRTSDPRRPGLPITQADALSYLETYREAPVRFSREILGAKPWAMARRIMQAVAKPYAQVAVRAAHATGKTHSAAQLVLWFVYTGGVVVTTASRFAQVRLLMWKEIHAAYNGSRAPLGGDLNQTELSVTGDAYAIGISTNDETRMQGFHGNRMLFVLDEAPGIKPAIYRAIDGARAGGDVRVLLLGNPNIPGGPYQQAFSDPGWKAFRIDAFDTPNLRDVCLPEDGLPKTDKRPRSLLELGEDELDVGPRPYLVTRRWALTMYRKHGIESPIWRSKVRGEFPQQAEDALYSIAWVDTAQAAADRPVPDDVRVTVGIDVAGPGDDETAMCVRANDPRDDESILEQRTWRVPDARGAVVEALGKYAGRLHQVRVDAIGIGYNFARHLEDQGFPVVDVNVGASPRDKSRFLNLRAEIAWHLRDLLRDGRVHGLRDEIACTQLHAIRYEHKSNGVIKIESKDDARKRGVKSPDRAEALILAFMPDPPARGVRSYLV